MKASVVIVEDNKMFNQMLQDFISRLNLKFESYTTGEEFFMKASLKKPHIYLIDQNLPGIKGSEIVKRIRSMDQYSPIFIISGESDEDSITIGLNSGADDYIHKPFNIYHLEMKIFNALARLSTISGNDMNKGIKFISGSKLICVRGQYIHLTSNEHLIMRVLYENMGTYVNKMNVLPVSPTQTSERNVDVHLHALRKKFRNSNLMIQNARGMGYRLQWTE